MSRVCILVELALLIMICIGHGVSHSEESDSRKQGKGTEGGFSYQMRVRRRGWDLRNFFSDPFLLRLS